MALTAVANMENRNITAVVICLATGRASRRWGEVAALLHLQGMGEGTLTALATDHLLMSEGLACAQLVTLARTRNPIDELLKTYRQTQESLDSLLPLPAHARWRAVREAAIRALMCSRSVSPSTIISREGAEHTKEWFNRFLREDERVSWLRRYLLAGSTDWAPRDLWLRHIVKTYGRPRGEAPFYGDLPQQVRDAIRRWQLEDDLAHYLGDDRRVAFWRNYLKELRNIETNSDAQALFLIFDSWCAIQFREMGRATYMFSAGHVVTMRKLSEADLYRRVLRLRETALGRYEHRGDHWEAAAHGVVVHVMRTAGN